MLTYMHIFSCVSVSFYLKKKNPIFFVSIV
uniref:Uncharacterized protein n=1 Tax=Rhizophora mucronata TaxID=61149 RepID=A0A2P2IZQ3_RHIMU